MAKSSAPGEKSGPPPERQQRPPRLVGADRVLATLVEVAKNPEGIALDDLARQLDSPKSTVHRALSSLRRAGLATQQEHGHYELGDEFLRLAFAFHAARPEHLRVQPALEALAKHFGETAHYAVLDGPEVVYRAKVDPPTGAIRLTSVIGGRNPAHCTAVGKLLLAHTHRTDSEVEAWAQGVDLRASTPHSITTIAGLTAELDRIRTQGFAVDAEENEEGINCVAIPAPAPSPAATPGAISVSALRYRMPLNSLVEQLPKIREIVGA